MKVILARGKNLSSKETFLWMCGIGRSIGKCFQGEAPADNGRFQGKKESRRGGKVCI